MRQLFCNGRRGLTTAMSDKLHFYINEMSGRKFKTNPVDYMLGLIVESSVEHMDTVFCSQAHRHAALPRTIVRTPYTGSHLLRRYPYGAAHVRSSWRAHTSEWDCSLPTVAPRRICRSISATRHERGSLCYLTRECMLPASAGSAVELGHSNLSPSNHMQRCRSSCMSLRSQESGAPNDDPF